MKPVKYHQLYSINVNLRKPLRREDYLSGQFTEDWWKKDVVFPESLMNFLDECMREFAFDCCWMEAP